jgi:hypothetical protein
LPLRKLAFIVEIEGFVESYVDSIEPHCQLPPEEMLEDMTRAFRHDRSIIAYLRGGLNASLLKQMGVRRWT